MNKKKNCLQTHRHVNKKIKNRIEFWYNIVESFVVTISYWGTKNEYITCIYNYKEHDKHPNYIYTYSFLHRMLFYILKKE